MISHDVKRAVALGLGLCKATYPNVDIAEQTVTAWASLLSDIDPNVIPLAMQTALRESLVPTLPPVGRVREIALYMMGESISSTAAWALAKRSVIERFLDGEYKYLIEFPEKLPERVMRALRLAIRRFGARNLKEAYSIGAQARFERLYREALREHDMLTMIDRIQGDQEKLIAVRDDEHGGR